MATQSNLVISAIAVQHAEDASFLWLLRTAATVMPHYSLDELAELDGRLEAHLDGLRIAYDAGWDPFDETLTLADPGEVFVASVLSFERDNSLLARLSEAAAREPELSRGLISAMGWLPAEQALDHVRALTKSAAHAERRMGVAAAVIQRLDLGRTLVDALDDSDSELRARALRAVGELGRLELVPLVEQHVQADDPEVRFGAAWSAAVLSPKPETLSALATIAQSESRHREKALETVMRRAVPESAKAWQQRLAHEAKTRQLAALGAGAMGDPAEVPWLIELMKTPELARVAGQSFTTITGVDLVYQDLEGRRPEGFESGPTEDPADENVEMDPDENLPWPEPELVQRWWQSNRHAFQPGTRYILGKPITVEWCKQVLRIGRQRQRAAAALELAMRQPGTPLFEVRAPGFRQKQLLGL
jgi:uncharacterized protein (TIGR02270 family)